MTDVDLRQTERALIAEPASLDLRRQHARLLQRAGDEERALSALDLAWRLGAEDLWDELQAALGARRLTIGLTTFAWIPGGPFVMGSDELDEDVAPAHLVTLPGYYVGVTALAWGALEGFSGFPSWLAGYVATEPRPDWVRRHLASPYVGERDGALAALAHLNEHAKAPDGWQWALPSEQRWERAMRASYLRPDGRSPYGVEPSDRLEWTSDLHDPAGYRGWPRGPVDGDLPPEPLPEKRGLSKLFRRDKAIPPQFALRGVPGLPPPHHALYREAAAADGQFTVEPGAHRVRTEQGIALRPVLIPTA